MASPANFATAPTSFGVVIQNTKIDFGKLYLRQILAGPGMNQSDVVDPNAATGLGQTAVNNWEIYDGVGSGAELVAYGQGMHTYAGNWQNWFTMLFEIQRFKGSTLQIMGASLDKSNEWAIVGGTGEFAMAFGVIQRTDYKFTGDEKIHELTIDGYCRMKLPPVPTPAKTSLLGGLGGIPRGIEGKSRRLESVTIIHTGIVWKLTFSYVGEDGLVRTAGPWGTHQNDYDFSSSSKTTITFGPSEIVTGISGIGRGSIEMSGLKIITNVKTYGPFGNNLFGTVYNTNVTNDKTVVGFHVQAGDDRIVKIGLYYI